MPRKPTCDCGTCRKCKHRDYMRRWYQSKTPEERRAWVALRDPERVRASDTARYHRDKAKHLARSKAWALAHPARIKAMKRGWVDRNPEKHRAHGIVFRALRDGLLVRQPCEVCGTAKHVHAHHEDYAKPLDVRWLCRTHHFERHRKRAA